MKNIYNIFLCLGLLITCSTKSYAEGFVYDIDPARTSVNEAQKKMHLALRVNVNWASFPRAEQAKLKTIMKNDVKLRNCAALKASKTEFNYIKKPGGMVEAELRDAKGVTIFTTNIPWAACK